MVCIVTQCLKLWVEPSWSRAVSEALIRAGASGVLESAEEGELLLTAYAPDEEAAAQFVAVVRERIGPSGALRRVECELFTDDWESAACAHVKPVRLTEGLVLIPVWGEVPERKPGQLLMRPALAFGFGDHPTTLLAAAGIAAACRERRPHALLDVGAGTGVLSFVALEAGCSRAVGLEIDPKALANARENAGLNGLGGRVVFTRELPPGESFELVVVNIELPGVLATAELSCSALAQGGRVLVTGLLEDQVEEVVARFLELGIALTLAAIRDGWVLLAGKRP